MKAKQVQVDKVFLQVVSPNYWYDFTEWTLKKDLSTMEQFLLVNFNAILEPLGVDNLQSCFQKGFSAKTVIWHFYPK